MKITPGKLIAAISTSLAIFSSSTAMAQGQDLDGLLLSSKQGMLAERVLKSYAQVVLHVQTEKAEPALQQAISDLRSNNVALKQSAPAGAVSLLNKQGKLIDQLSGVVSQPASAETLNQAYGVSEELWVNAESATKTYHGTAPAALLSLASGQRMLTQRTAAMYFLQQTSLKSTEIRKRLAESDDAFKNTTAAFEDHKDDFPGITTNLELARLQMIFFDNAVHHIDAPTKEQLQSVATASERILSQMEELTKNVQNRMATQVQPAKTRRK